MVNVQLESLDKLQRTDHDTLIRMETKLDQVLSDTKRAQEDHHLRWADHEGRIKTIERVHEAINPEQAFKELEEVVQWKHDTERDVKFGKQVGRFLWGVVGGVIIFVLQYIIQYLHLLK